MTNLIIGTANFGNNYGITKGNIDETHAKEILALAKHNKINTIDTAYLYGNSYEVLSKSESLDFNIITKTPKFSNCKTRDEVINLVHKFIDKTKSTFDLNNIQAILLHDPQDLLSEYGDIIYLELKKLSNLHNIKIGISVYDVSELLIANKYDIDIVQVPLNIFDQRFIADDVIDFLQSKNIEIHSRSLFLQGILLMSSEQVKAERPKALSYIDELDKICLKNKISRLELSIIFIKRVKYISSIVIGINNLKNLEEIVNTWSSGVENKISDINFGHLAINNNLITDPRKWVN